jgi:flagellar protein FlaG
MKEPNMNIQPSAVSASSVETSVARVAHLPGTSGQMDAATPQPPPLLPANAQQPVSDKVLKQVAQEVNDYLKSSKSSLQFEVDGKSKQVVVRIVDSETKEVIRQMPPEYVLRLAEDARQSTG